jgi:hypothetical protein
MSCIHIHTLSPCVTRIDTPIHVCTHVCSHHVYPAHTNSTCVHAPHHRMCSRTRAGYMHIHICSYHTTLHILYIYTQVLKSERATMRTPVLTHTQTHDTRDSVYYMCTPHTRVYYSTASKLQHTRANACIHTYTDSVLSALVVLGSRERPRLKPLKRPRARGHGEALPVYD